MKVTQPNSASVPAASPRASQSSSSAEPVDRVSVTPSSLPSSASASTAGVDASRTVRVQEIAKAVQSGQYYPSPQQIAQRLVSEAEVEARLRAMLAT